MTRHRRRTAFDVFAAQAVEHAGRLTVELRGALEAAVAQLDDGNDDRARDVQRIVELLRVVGVRVEGLRVLLNREPTR